MLDSTVGMNCSITCLRCMHSQHPELTLHVKNVLLCSILLLCSFSSQFISITFFVKEFCIHIPTFKPMHLRWLFPKCFLLQEKFRKQLPFSIKLKLLLTPLNVIPKPTLNPTPPSFQLLLTTFNKTILKVILYLKA